MIVKKYVKIALVTTSILCIFLFMGGCSGLDIGNESKTTSAENLITESTNLQSSEQQQNINQDYEKWKCIEKGCNYIYDPSIGDPTQGIEPGTKFEDLPDSWRCPVCGKGKDHFVKYNG